MTTPVIDLDKFDRYEIVAPDDATSVTFFMVDPETVAVAAAGTAFKLMPSAAEGLRDWLVERLPPRRSNAVELV
jgi:hypothetical protein